MKKRLSAKNKEKIKNVFALIIILLFVLSVAGYIMYDKNRIKQHYLQCIELCKPDKALEIFSKKGCFCEQVIKEETFDIKSSI